MSVEEAREAVMNAVGGLLDDYAPQTLGKNIPADELDAALDRLTLEVQAEMPCYKTRIEEEDNQRWVQHCGSDGLCPACRAKMALDNTPALVAE